MRVAVVVHFFHPHVGGLEMTAEVLATGLATRYGDDVLVITHTPDASDDARFPFRVLRVPNRSELLRAISGADVVLHNNPCLQMYWPQPLVRTPLVMALRSYVTLPGQRLSVAERVKYHAKYALIQGADELTTNSMHMAHHLSRPMTVIPNSYRDKVFTVTEPVETRDPNSIVYFGRLTEDKGGEVFVRAAGELLAGGTHANFTVLGDGPELTRLRELATELGISSSVTFLGATDGVRAARVLNQHAIAVVPSLVPESFGTVALEMAASGCVVVGSDIGGLPEAVGPCGPLFPSGDVNALTEVLLRLITDPEARARYRSAAAEHVAAHREHIMVDRYREVLARVASGAGRNQSTRSLRDGLQRWLHPWPRSSSPAEARRLVQYDPAQGSQGSTRPHGSQEQS